MEVFSEERIFHQTVWTTTESFSSNDNNRLPPCVALDVHFDRNRNDTLPHLNRFDFRPFVSSSSASAGIEEPPKRFLEPSPTFASCNWQQHRDLLRPASPTFPSPPLSPLAGYGSAGSPSSSPLPSPVFKGFGFGSSGVGEVRGNNNNINNNNNGMGSPVGFGYGENMAVDEPLIKLAPILLPEENEEKCSTVSSNAIPFVPVKTESFSSSFPKNDGVLKDKKIGVASVPFKKSARPDNTGKLTGILVVQTTTQSTVTSVSSLLPPSKDSTQVVVAKPPKSVRRKKSPSSSSSSSSSSASSKKKEDAESNGNRKRVTPEQLAILENEFERGMIPDLETRKRLAERLGFTERRVQVWFQNRRAKMKKDNHSTPIFIINCGINSFKH